MLLLWYKWKLQIHSFLLLRIFWLSKLLILRATILNTSLLLCLLANGSIYYISILPRDHPDLLDHHSFRYTLSSNKISNGENKKRKMKLLKWPITQIYFVSNAMKWIQSKSHYTYNSNLHICEWIEYSVNQVLLYGNFTYCTMYYGWRAFMLIFIYVHICVSVCVSK